MIQTAEQVFQGARIALRNARRIWIAGPKYLYHGQPGAGIAHSECWANRANEVRPIQGDPSNPTIVKIADCLENMAVWALQDGSEHNPNAVTDCDTAIADIDAIIDAYPK